MEEAPLLREGLEELARQKPLMLVEMVLEQRRAIEQQRQAIAALERRVSELEEALRQSRGGGPGAAPFRIEPHRRKEAPKAPGRGEGHRGEFRTKPEQVDETIEVPLKQCPSCGSTMGKTTRLEQTIIELPPVRPLVVRLITHRGRCEHC